MTNTSNQPTATQAAAQLIGGWTVVGGEKYGRPEPPDRVVGTIVRFTADRVTVTDVTDNERYAAAYQIDTSAVPWRLTMTATAAPNAGDVAVGLIELTGPDDARLIYALPGSEPPTEFRTKAGQLMFTLKNKNREPRDQGQPS